MDATDKDAMGLRSLIDRLEEGGERRLPPEPRLSAALGVSRSRLRTLLKQLEDEGAIWRHVGKGTFIGPRQAAVTLDDAGLARAISVDDIFSARLLLEPRLAAQAAIHANAQDIDNLKDCLAEMSGATSFVQWKRLDDRLHRTIAEATHNPLLLILYDTLRSQMKLGIDARVQEVFGQLAQPRRSTDVEHEGVVAAILAHAPERAEQAMRDHIASVRQNLFGSH
ncbi:FadR/GntR family transcriptional regulator [Rhizorhabdus wittichii]|uniref:FadR/GntR family transcriptional regulator n=1 Tax=Rhizorhabdus wittichii TaxID=160791 RepID=UPI0003619507|nr:FCD domain-containing protein [Rhizorhabdus wittichii]